LLPPPPGLQLLVKAGFPCLAWQIEKKLAAHASQQETSGFVESHSALQVASVVPDRRLLDCEEAIPGGLVSPFTHLNVSPTPVKPSNISNSTPLSLPSPQATNRSEADTMIGARKVV